MTAKRNASPAPKGRWVSKGRADISPLVVAGDETPVWVQGHEGHLIKGRKGLRSALCSWSTEHEGSWSRCNGESVANPRAHGGRVEPEGVHGGRDGPPGKVGVVLPRRPCAPYRSQGSLSQSTARLVKEALTREREAPRGIDLSM